MRNLNSNPILYAGEMQVTNQSGPVKNSKTDQRHSDTTYLYELLNQATITTILTDFFGKDNIIDNSLTHKQQQQQTERIIERKTIAIFHYCTIPCTTNIVREYTMTANKMWNVSVPLLLLLVALTIRNGANAWTPQQQLSRGKACPTVSRTTPLYMSTEDEIAKQEQIAKLEAELRQLKEGQSAETEETAEEDEEMLEEASMDMFLSEGWKEAREGYDPKNTATATRQAEEQGSLVGTVAKVVGAIVALVFFSQIPVGQEDLSKYSAIKSGPTKATIDLGDTNRVKGQILNANTDYESQITAPEE